MINFTKTILTAVLTIFATLQVNADPANLRVGAILGLTGEGAISGSNIRDGLMFGLGELPDNIKQQIEFKFDDDQLKPTNSIAAFNKLSKFDDINLLINASAPTGHALAPLADRANIPFISLSSDARLTQQGKHTYLFWPTPERLTKRAVDECLSRGIAKIAIVTTQNDGRFYVRDQFLKNAKDKIQIIANEEFLPDVRDFRSTLTRLAGRKDIDAIFINLFFGQIGNFARQSREVGISTPLFGVDLMADPNEVVSSHGALAGAWYVGGFQGSDEFLKRFQKKYSKASTFGAVYGYDIALLLGSFAEQRTKGRSLDQILTAGETFKGELGEYTLGADNRFDLPVEVKLIQG